LQCAKATQVREYGGGCDQVAKMRCPDETFMACVGELTALLTHIRNLEAQELACVRGFSG
jgi:hypothetical protein